MSLKSSYDYYLVLATTVVLFMVSAICICGMFYFKLAQIQNLPVTVKVGYMNTMNTVMAPFLIGLIVLLGICVPKRLLPSVWLNRFSIVLVLLAVIISMVWNVKAGLAFVLVASGGLQIVVFLMALAGSQRLNFERTGYWVRVGSSLLHLGLIIFMLDVFFYRYPRLHLILFWVTTVATTIGMVICFYADTCVKLVKKTRGFFLKQEGEKK